MIYILIVTYNAMPWIQKCLESCRDLKVIVVDNNSSDGTVRFIKENFPKVHVLPQKENLGFGQGNNMGIRYALEQGTDFVFLLNQDAYLQEGCIEKLVAVQQQHPGYGILSPIHYNGAGSNLDDKFLLYLNRYKIQETLLFDTFKNSLSEIYSIEFVNAAGWLITRKCLETVGGFDPLFFHYGEDRNYCQRVQYHGFKVGIVPTALIYHDREDRSQQNIEKYSEKYYKEFERYLKVDWADINLPNFVEKYTARTNYLRSKRRRFLLKLQFTKAKDCQLKRKLMLQLKAAIEKSRLLSTENQMPYL